ncbi:MAG: hypothetical protein H0W78_10090 [Planctomycetes bacterium]|nr:hypothetical protein [Planctomycetota bacterium]
MRATVALCLLLISTVASAQVAVVNIGVRDAVDRDHLRNMLLGRVTTWADGTQVVLILSSDPGSRAAIEELTGRDLGRLLRGWKRILFSGNGAMPISTSGADEALVAVAQRPGAIAIVGVVPPADPRMRVAVTLDQGKAGQ